MTVAPVTEGEITLYRVGEIGRTGGRSDTTLTPTTPHQSIRPPSTHKIQSKQFVTVRRVNHISKCDTIEGRENVSTDQED
jgi:hypothetical protein